MENKWEYDYSGLYQNGYTPAQPAAPQPPQPEDCPLLREEEVHLELLRPEWNGEQ